MARGDFAVYMPMAPEMWADEPIRPTVREMAARQVPPGYVLYDEETSISMVYPEEEGADPYEVFAVRFLYRLEEDEDGS